MQQEDENKGGAAGSKSFFKKYWWLPFLGVFLFLLAGGYYAMVSMRQSAHKLAAGDNYDQLSASSAASEAKAAPGAGQAFFTGTVEDETAPAGAPSSAKAGGHLTLLLAGRSGVQTESSVQGGQHNDTEAAAASAGGGGAAPAPGSAMATRLQGLGGSLGKPGGSKNPQGAARSLGFKADGTVVGITGGNAAQKGAGQAKKAGSGVLDSLKGAFRASLYGARTASEDSAKNWSARSFDATPEATTSLQYSEAMRKDLDTVDPNAIPDFLRDQDISAEGMARMANSEVARPVLDKEATKAAMARAKEKDPEAFTKNLLDGMMNGMFKGMGPKTKEAQDSSGGDGNGNSDMSLLSDPKADNSNCQAGCADEFGYVSYGSPTGFQTIFDEDGNQVGCTNNALGMSYPFGAPGCP